MTVDADDFVLHIIAWDMTMQALSKQNGSPPMGMLVGTWAGLALGTKRPELAARVRQTIERWIGENIEVPPEVLESEIMSLLEKVDPGGK